jgi:hypothetical protein
VLIQRCQVHKGRNIRNASSVFSPGQIAFSALAKLRDHGPNSSLKIAETQRPGIRATSFGRLGVARLPLFGNFSYPAIFCAILTNFKLNKLPLEAGKGRNRSRRPPGGGASAAVGYEQR